MHGIGPEHAGVLTFTYTPPVLARASSSLRVRPPPTSLALKEELQQGEQRRSMELYGCLAWWHGAFVVQGWKGWARFASGKARRHVGWLAKEVGGDHQSLGTTPAAAWGCRAARSCVAQPWLDGSTTPRARLVAHLAVYIISVTGGSSMGREPSFCKGKHDPGSQPSGQEASYVSAYKPPCNLVYNQAKNCSRCEAHRRTEQLPAHASSRAPMCCHSRPASRPRGPGRRTRRQRWWRCRCGCGPWSCW